MKWSKTKPTVPGFYWARYKDNTSIVKVYIDANQDLYFLTLACYDLPVAEAPPDYEWAGPMDEPGEGNDLSSI